MTDNSAIAECGYCTGTGKDPALRNYPCRVCRGKGWNRI